MDRPTKLSISFDEEPSDSTPSLKLPSKPVGPADTILAEALGQEGGKEMLVCNQMLDDESLAKAQTKAAELLPAMMSNTEMLRQFGQDAVADMNALIDDMLARVKPVEIPELTQLMRGLSGEMRQLKGRYDISQPKIAKKLERAIAGHKSLFNRGASLIEQLMAEAEAIQAQIDHIKGELGEKQLKMVANILLYDELYLQNEEEILKVIKVIAVLELVRDFALEKMQSIDADENSPADRQKVEQRRAIADFVALVNMQIIEYKNRLFVGWSTSPQIHNMRTLDVALAQKLFNLMNLTIPVMKSTILQWRLLIESMQSGEAGEVVADAANEWLVAYAQAGANATPQIAQMGQTPTVTPETVANMADSIAQQAESIQEAYIDGTRRRAEVDNAIVTAQRLSQVASEAISDAVVDELLVHATNRLALGEETGA